LLPHMDEAEKVLDSINAVFKDKDLDTVMREGSNFKRDLLAELVFSLKNVLGNLIESFKSCSSNSSPCPFVKKDELQGMLTSLIPMISKSVKETLSEPDDRNVCDTHQPCSQPISNPVIKDDHVIVPHGEVSDDNFSGFNDEKWNTVVKKNLSKKLKSIPIKNSVKTKGGKACLFVEGEANMNKVKAALKDDYNVEASKPRAKMKEMETVIKKLQV